MPVEFPIGRLVGAQYKYKHGPWMLQDKTAAELKEMGLNCQLLTHAIYTGYFGVQLPMGMWSSEIFYDHELFTEVPAHMSRDTADIVFLGPTNLSDAKKLHLGVLGSGGEDSLIIHSSFYSANPGVIIEPMKKIQEIARYAQIYGVRRLAPELHKSYILPLSGKFAREISDLYFRVQN